jgi:hypothetical protein
MKRYLGSIISVLLFVLFIIMINIITNKSSKDFLLAQEEYFHTLDLKLKGTVCNVELQNDTYKYLITVDVTQSNYINFDKKLRNTLFCLKKDNIAVFADHSDSYEVGDIVEIGVDSTYLISCMNRLGQHKFKKKRDDMMVYRISSPHDRMIKLVEYGCRTESNYQKLNDGPNGTNIYDD